MKKAASLPRIVLIAGLLLASSLAQAQTYSKTETITYHDNTTKWVLGQTASITCVASIPASTSCNNDSSDGYNDVVSATTFDPTHALPLTTASFGKPQSTMTYDTTSTVASGHLGTLKTVKDGRNNTTTFSNWMRGIPQTIAYGDSTSQSAVVNDSGWITSVTNEVGAKTCYGYDTMGRLASITQPSETTAGVCDTSRWTATTRSFVPVAAAEYGIPAGHWRETVSTGNGTKITYYDAMWRPLLVREYDAGNVAATERFTKAAYDAEGRVSFASYPSTSSSPTTGVWTTYDALGRVSSVSQDSEQGLLTTTTTYNPGFTTTVTNPRTYPTTTSYLTYDQPTTDWPLTITAPENAVTTIARDPHGKPTSLTRSGGGVTPVVRTYSYNVNQELCRSEEPETGATLYGYDAAGNLASSAAGLAIGTACGTANSRTVSRSYDTRNRLTNLTFPDGKGNQTWTYYNDGLLNQITTYNEAGNTGAVTNAYTYNQRRMLVGESLGQPGWYTWSIGYGYDANGNLSNHNYPTGLVVYYAPNALGQTTAVTDSAGRTLASGASYYPNRALKQFTYGNGIVHTMTQNARQLPLRSTDTGTADYEYGYDTNGNVGYVYDQLRGSGYSRWMNYDGLDRLTAAGSASFGGDHWHRFTYDALDNLKSWKLAGVKDYATYTYSNNRLTSIQNTAGASVVGLTYDVQGNLAAKNGQASVFDYGNRLREVSANRWYRYDGMGRRVINWPMAGNGDLSQYSQDGKLIHIADYTGAYPEGGVSRDHIYLAGSLLAIVNYRHTDWYQEVKYQHTDALGSPVAVTNQAGTVIDRTDWEPYGAAIGKPNYDGVGYTGHVMDGTTGLTYMQQRYYDPQIGRFLSVDPVTANADKGINFNRYWYADNNPYRFVDPDGREVRNSDRSLCRNAGNPCTIISGGLDPGESRESSSTTGKGAVAGAVVGTVAGAVVAGGCDYASAGGCIAANPQIVGGMAILGAVTGDSIERAWAQLERLVARASSESGGDHIQYALVASQTGLYPTVRGGVARLNAGDVWKYGTTMMPGGRYPVSGMAGLGLVMVEQSRGGYFQMLAQEKMMLIGYATTHGELPPGNRIFK